MVSEQTIDNGRRLAREGKVHEIIGARSFGVESGDRGLYTVTIKPDELAVCTCKAGREGVLCKHVIGVGVVMADDMLKSARQLAWDRASAALRELFEIVETEDTIEGEGGDQEPRTTLLETLDRFDDARNIDQED